MLQVETATLHSYGRIQIPQFYISDIDCSDSNEHEILPGFSYFGHNTLSHPVLSISFSHSLSLAISSSSSECQRANEIHTNLSRDMISLHFIAGQIHHNGKKFDDLIGYWYSCTLYDVRVDS